MKKVGLLVITALMLAAFSGNYAYAQGPANQITVSLMEQNSSGQSGTATISEQNGTLMVSLNLSNGTDTPQPAHIHKGTCANLDPSPLVPLTNVVNGKSDTTIGTDAAVHSMADLSSGTYAINVHKSAAEAKIYVACGDIHAMMMGGAAGGAGTGTGTTGTGTGTGDTGTTGTTTGTTGDTSGTMGGTSTPGMPSTGNAGDALTLFALVLSALALVGTGVKVRFAHRKI